MNLKPYHLKPIYHSLFLPYKYNYLYWWLNFIQLLQNYNNLFWSRLAKKKNPPALSLRQEDWMKIFHSYVYKHNEGFSLLYDAYLIIPLFKAVNPIIYYIMQQVLSNNLLESEKSMQNQSLPIFDENQHWLLHWRFSAFLLFYPSGCHFRHRYSASVAGRGKSFIKKFG